MIRHAKKSQAEILTKISFKSKGYWGYPRKYFDRWSDKLTITSDYIRKNDVFVFENENNGETIGYYSIVELEDDIEVSGIKINKGFWLEHMFIEPEFIP